METEYPKQKKITTKDGTVMHLWGRQLHNFLGPAVIPQGNNKLAEYYIFGIKYTKDKWEESKKEQSKGIPQKPVGDRF